jgi:hypothetical protein
MAMPTGDTPQKAQAYYEYLQAHQLAPHGRIATWHVDWTALAWLWGFAIVLVILLAVWVRDYRSTHPQTGISPLDRWSGYTTEAAGRVPFFFWLVTLAIVGLGAELVIGHVISGQRF